MNPILEKAALALARNRVDPKRVLSEEQNAPHIAELWANPYIRESLIREVRDVLEAIRFVDEETEAVSRCTLSSEGVDYYPKYISDYHRAMIDAILKERHEPQER